MIEDIEVLYIKTENIPRASTLGIQFLGKEEKHEIVKFHKRLHSTISVV